MKWRKCIDVMPPPNVPVLVYNENAGKYDDPYSVAKFGPEYDFDKYPKWRAACAVSGYEWDWEMTPTHWALIEEPIA